MDQIGMNPIGWLGHKTSTQKTKKKKRKEKKKKRRKMNQAEKRLIYSQTCLNA